MLFCLKNINSSGDNCNSNNDSSVLDSHLKYVGHQEAWLDSFCPKNNDGFDRWAAAN